MEPNSNPTPADVNMVAQAMGATAPQEPAPQAPAPVQAPAPQQQPAQPTPQPAPTQQQGDPFESLFASQPAEPTAPTQPQTPQPTQPTEPTSPTPQSPQPAEPTPQPAPVAQPQTPAPVAEAPFETYEQYIDRITGGQPQAPAQPDPEKIDPNNPEAIKGFFDDLVNTAVERSRAEVTRASAIQAAEKTAWDSAFDKYGSLRTNKQLRDMVHSIRMGYFQRNIALTPTQAADKLLETMKGSYQRGVADNQVHTTIESVQPNGGGTNEVATTAASDNIYTAVQDGGEVALTAILDNAIKNGTL